MKNYELPLGFGMALSQNPEAMERFATLSETKKREIINGTHTITSKEEMWQYVNEILA